LFGDPAASGDLIGRRMEVRMFGRSCRSISPDFLRVSHDIEGGPSLSFISCVIGNPLTNAPSALPAVGNSLAVLDDPAVGHGDKVMKAFA
jgi:hypothetical protein